MIMAMMRVAVIRPPSLPLASGFGLDERSLGFALLHLRDHQNLGLLHPSLRAVAITVPIAVTIAVTVAITAIAAGAVGGLGQGCAENPAAGCLEPIERLDCGARAGLPGLDDEQRAARRGSEQRRVGQAERRR